MTVTQFRGLQRRLEQRFAGETGRPNAGSPDRLVRERVDQAMADRPVAYISGQDWEPAAAGSR